MQVGELPNQQAQGVQQVTTAIQEMEKHTQTAAATAEESAAASEELNAQAEVSMHQVQELERMVGGASVAARAPMPAVVGKPARVAAAKVLTLGRRKTAEEQIPLDDTGSFGSF